MHYIQDFEDEDSKKFYYTEYEALANVLKNGKSQKGEELDLFEFSL